QCHYIIAESRIHKFNRNRARGGVSRSTAESQWGRNLPPVSFSERKPVLSLSDRFIAENKGIQIPLNSK
uniref:hypothetical protein n=1 Tax=Alistipes shahii TaxID=328814 RepID=UPI00307969F3